jgi:hypothetical protein
MLANNSPCSLGDGIGYLLHGRIESSGLDIDINTSSAGEFHGGWHRLAGVRWQHYFITFAKTCSTQGGPQSYPSPPNC